MTGKPTVMGQRGLRAGFSLVEVMVALLVIAVGFTALLASVVVGLDNVQKSNAELTGYVAARNLVDRIEAHFSIPLDGLAFETPTVLATAAPLNNNPYLDYYLPGAEAEAPSGDDTKKYSDLYNAANCTKSFDGPAWLSLPLVYKLNFVYGHAHGIPGTLNPCSSGAVPSVWLDNSNPLRFSLGSTLDPYPNYFTSGPYRLMVDMENLDAANERAGIYNAATTFYKPSYKQYKITVWVFGADFPKKRVAEAYGATLNVAADVVKEQIKKEALGVYTFTVRLGKAVSPFRPISNGAW